MALTRTPTDPLPVRELTLLSATLFAAVSTELIPIGLLPQLSTAFGVGAAQIGWWTSVYALVVAVGAVPLTAVASRFGQRRALLALLGCYVLSNLLVVLAGSFPSFELALVARVLGGLAHAAFFSVVIATAVRISPPSRTGSAVTVVSSGVMAAFAFGVPLATAAGEHLGWRSAFYGTAVLLFALLVLAGVLLPADASRARHRTGTENAVPVHDRDLPPAEVRSTSNRGILLVGAYSMLFLLGHTTGYTYVTELLRRAGAATEVLGPLLFAFGLGSLLGVLVAARVADAHPTATLRVCGAVLMACLAAFVFPPPVVGVAVGAVLLVAWGASYGGLPAMLQTAGLRVCANPATAPAVVNSTTNAGIAAGAWLGGAVLSQGVGAVAGVGSLVILVALALTFVPVAQAARAVRPSFAR